MVAMWWLSLDTRIAERPDFLEIWERDVLNPEMQVALQMTRAQLLRSPAAKRLTL